MKYKAIIFDLDGTAMPNKREGVPGKHLTEVVQKIRDKIFVSAATGRGIVLSRHIFKQLGLTAPCIVSGGTRIVDPVTEKVLWEKSLEVQQIEKIKEVVVKYPHNIYMGNGTAHISPHEINTKEPRGIIYVEPVPPEDAKKILAELEKIPDIVAHPVMSWTDGHFDIHITHREATKKHAIAVLLDLLKVKKEEVIGFGDSNNDLPIFEMVGYKVAMSNGSPDLKNAADLVAPNEDHNGVARTIESLL